jgi:hypothetical protein
LRQANSKPVSVLHGNHGDGPGPSPSRSRNQFYLYANSYAVGIFNQDVLKQEFDLCERYVSEICDRMIILHCDVHNHIKRIPYFTRFSVEYSKSVRRKLWRKIFPNLSQFRDFLFLTLTIDPKRFASQAQARSMVSKEWNVLVTRIRKAFPWVRVIRCFEWQENGIGIHVHALLCGLRYIPKDWIAITWEKLSSSGWSIEIERVFDNPKRALNYILKYIVKQYKEKDLNTTKVINWALNVRSYGLSRFSSHKNNSNQNSSCQWVFIGSLPLLTANSMDDRAILEFLVGDGG